MGSNCFAHRFIPSTWNNTWYLGHAQEMLLNEQRQWRPSLVYSRGAVLPASARGAGEARPRTGTFCWVREDEGQERFESW